MSHIAAQIGPPEPTSGDCGTTLASGPASLRSFLSHAPTPREVGMWEILDVLRRIGRGENKSVVA